MKLVIGNTVEPPTGLNMELSTVYRFRQGKCLASFDSNQPYLTFESGDNEATFRGFATLGALNDLVDCLTAARDQWCLVEAAKIKPTGAVS